MRMFESTDIYRVIFFKKAFFGVGVSVIYIPLPIFNRHIPTHKKQNRYQWKTKPTPLKLKFTVFLQFCCSVVSGLRLGESRYSVVCFLTCSWAILTLQRLLLWPWKQLRANPRHFKIFIRLNFIRLCLSLSFFLFTHRPIEGKNNTVWKSIPLIAFLKIVSIVFGIACQQNT